MTESRNVNSSQPSSRLVPLGRALLAAGVVLFVLRGLTLTRQLPGLPAFWYANQPIWVTLAFGLAATGWQVLWGSPPKRTYLRWQPGIPGGRFRTAILYSSQGCHLCDDAAEVLSRYLAWLPPIERIDIGSDAVLVEQFGTCVPVLVLDGKVRFRGRVSEDLLRRLIEGTPPIY